MKVKSLTIKNIGLIANETIPFDKPLILFYGEIRQGKTTILNAARWGWGGAFPQDIIKHGQTEASIEFVFDGGMVSRSFYKAKDGTTKARALVFVRDGKPVKNPATEIEKILNPFQLDQDFLRNKSEGDRKLFFAELFALDTTALDKEWFENDHEASNLRIQIKSYGDIDLTPVEPVDASALRQELAGIRADYAEKKIQLEGQLTAMSQHHDTECQSVDRQNDAIRQHNNDVERQQTAKTAVEEEIISLQKRIGELVAKLALMQVPAKKELKPRPAQPDRSPIQKKILEITPDTSAIEAKIQDAGAANVRAEQFAKNKARAADKAADEQKVSALEKRQREIKLEKAAKLKEISNSSGIKELEFDDEGNFIYQGCQAGMLSTSQVMRLSSELSALYPEGFGLDLIDRGESLGKSIFEFVERAKREEKTILVTVVGEPPANAPEDIGVFVVKEGKVGK